MLTVLIEAREGQEEKLARTLHSLVGAAVEGIVREVIVASPDGSGEIAKVADHAGCRVAESLGSGVSMAKAEWLLVLEPGARLMEGWTQSAAAHAMAGGGPARLTRAVGRWSLAALGERRRPFAHGLLVRRQEALSGALERRSRLSRLAARVVPAD